MRTNCAVTQTVKVCSSAGAHITLQGLLLRQEAAASVRAAGLPSLFEHGATLRYRFCSGSTSQRPHP